MLETRFFPCTVKTVPLPGLPMQSINLQSTVSTNIINKLHQDMTSLVRKLSRNVDRCEAASGMNNSAVATVAARVSTLEGNRSSAELDNKIGR